MSKLDDVSWHLGGGEFPADIPEENSATHIGLFVAWAINKGLWRALPGIDWSTHAEMVRNRTITGRNFVLTQCDGKLLSEMLNDEGASFAQTYYPHTYLGDFRRTLASSLASDYLVQDTWDNYDRMAAVIDSRFEKSKEKRWWKL